MSKKKSVTAVLANAMTPIAEPVPLLKLDLGCGPNKREGFHGVDSIPFVGVDTVTDLRKPWPFADSSVSEAHCSHCIEHFTGEERVHICNELHRVLVPGGTCLMIAPYWESGRAYGDFTHQWPPICGFWFQYLKKEWRAANAPHNDIKFNPKGYSCDFEVTWGFNLRGDVAVRNQEWQQFAMANYKEVCQDVIATFKKV